MPTSPTATATRCRSSTASGCSFLAAPMWMNRTTRSLDLQLLDAASDCPAVPARPGQSACVQNRTTSPLTVRWGGERTGALSRRRWLAGASGSQLPRGRLQSPGSLCRSAVRRLSRAPAFAAHRSRRAAAGVARAPPAITTTVTASLTTTLPLTMPVPLPTTP